MTQPVHGVAYDAPLTTTEWLGIVTTAPSSPSVWRDGPTPKPPTRKSTALPTHSGLVHRFAAGLRFEAALEVREAHGHWQPLCQFDDKSAPRLDWLVAQQAAMLLTGHRVPLPRASTLDSPAAGWRGWPDYQGLVQKEA